MRITRLVLKNWGPHKSLDLDMDTPVFGLLGPNASGKSNIMSAIAFGFTGILDLNQATYVRQAAGEDIANGSVDIYFIKGGIKGRIFRQVGKSPSRKLWWEDWSKPITKSADIDKLMSQILDCDKKAIDQAVFLSQGHLADFLTGTPAQREDDFARMCLIDKLGLVADVAAQEIVRLQKTVTDLTSQRDEALLTKEQAEAALRTSESELELHPDMTIKMNWLRECINRTSHALRYEEQSQIHLGAYQGAKEKLASIQCPDFSTSEKAEEDLDELKKQAAACEAAVGEVVNLRKLLEQDRNNEQRLKAAALEVDSILEKSPRMNEIQELLTKLQNSLLSMQKYEHWKLTYDAWIDRLNRMKTSMQEAEKELHGFETEEAYQQILQDAQKALAELAGEKFRLNLAKSAEGHVTGCCPLCQGTDLSKLPAGAELQKALDNLANLERNSLSLAQKAEADIKARSLVVQKLEGRRAMFADVEKESVSLWSEGEPPDLSAAPAVRAQIAELEKERSALQGLLGSIPGLYAEMERLKTSLAQRQPEAFYVEKIADGERRQAEAPEVIAKRTRLSTYVSNRKSHLEAVNTAYSHFTKSTEDAAEARKKVDEHWMMKDPGLLLDKAATQDTLKSSLTELESKQAEREKVNGAIRANAENLRRAEKRISEIDERVQRNAATMSVIGNLEELKNAFSRFGIPRHYLAKVFEALVLLTQENLADWDTDFQVELDPDNLFNFLFYRTDEPDTTLDQSQLSGGQKTRLALSFVQAVQRLLYPGLDFLCVDEPSNHLDSEGVEGLARLFQTIAAQNEEGEAQVIVVDHNPLLQRAFSKSVTLSRLKTASEASAA